MNDFTDRQAYQIPDSVLRFLLCMRDLFKKRTKESKQSEKYHTQKTICALVTLLLELRYCSAREKMLRRLPTVVGTTNVNGTIKGLQIFNQIFYPKLNILLIFPSQHLYR